MKILQLDVESISYELIKPEAQLYEESSEKNVTVKDALVLMTCIEKGDTPEIIDAAFADVEKFMRQLKRKNIVIYPFAHLSGNLAPPKEALERITQLSDLCSKEFKMKKAPFGWNKRWVVEMKGHPMAEQLRSYPKAGRAVAEQQSHAKVERKSAVDTSIVKKSTFAGLPDTDHRIIGEKLDLFSFQEVSPGMVYWHNNGMIVFKELMRFIREKLADNGYQEISTPAIANIALWHVSGHAEHFKDDMFVFDAASEQLALKPMNCPSTMMVYKSRKWSYRDLPVRLSDFDRLYRNEISGALTGLFRVREITQDDAHLFMTDDQLEDEIGKILGLVKEFYSKFGLAFVAKLSTMPDDHMGSEELWLKAIDHLKSALKKNKLEYGIKEKDGAFYGPKIDFQIKDSLGREWQCATVQVDYQLPQRFKLSYTAEDGAEHVPVVVHRVIYGSLERFLGILIEHCQGKFPTWLAPVQATVITISEESNKYGAGVHQRLKAAGMRAALDDSDKTLEYKIREATLQKVPYLIIIGKKEAEKGTITVRSRSGKQKHDVATEEFVEKVSGEIAERANELSY